MSINKLALSLIFSSLVAGFVFWALVYAEFIIGFIFINHWFPLDSFVFLVPILLIATTIGILICMPIFLLLEKFGFISFKIILVVAISVSCISVFLLTKDLQSILYYLAAVTAAAVASVTFIKLIPITR